MALVSNFFQTFIVLGMYNFGKLQERDFFVILEIECMNAVCPLLLFAMAILTCDIHDRGKKIDLG